MKENSFVNEIDSRRVVDKSSLFFDRLINKLLTNRLSRTLTFVNSFAFSSSLFSIDESTTSCVDVSSTSSRDCVSIFETNIFFLSRYLIEQSFTKLQTIQNCKKRSRLSDLMI